MENWFFSSTIIKLNMSELYDNLAHEKLTMKSLVKFWQSVNGFLSTEVDENVITTDYFYYDDDQSFDHEKILMFFKKNLKVAKFDKKTWWIDPVLSAWKSSFNYRELIFERSLNFVTQFNIM